jgi:hypothetical protein
MPRIGFEATIPASKRAKTVHPLDHLATVTGIIILARKNMKLFSFICIKVSNFICICLHYASLYFKSMQINEYVLLASRIHTKGILEFNS